MAELEGPSLAVPRAERAGPSPLAKLNFIRWGIRWLDLPILTSFSTMGALLAVKQWDPALLRRFIIFMALNYTFAIHVYLYNDWCDAALNPDEPRRRKRHALKGDILTRGQVLGVSILFAVLALAGFGALAPRLLIPALSSISFTILYSHPSINFKGQPIASTLIHFFGAAFYFCLGWMTFAPLTATGVGLAIFFGTTLSAGHFSNEIDDFRQDLAAGIRTNAIAFGQRTVFRAGLVLFVLSSALLAALAALRLGTYFQFIAFALIYLWIYLAWQYRGWKGGDDIGRFRMYYRMIYANVCGFMILLKCEEWMAASLPFWIKP